MNVVQFKRSPSDLAQRFRELADLADKGGLTDAVVSFIGDGHYGFVYGASLSDCIVLSSLLHQNCIDRMRA